MAVWLLLLLLLLAAVALLLLRRARLRRRAPQLQGRTLFNLTTGDIVQHDGRDWVVEDRLLTTTTVSSGWSTCCGTGPRAAG